MVESPNTASAFPSWLIMTHHVASPVQQDPSLVSSFFHVFVPSILLMCSFVSHRMSIDVPSNVIKCQFFPSSSIIFHQMSISPSLFPGQPLFLELPTARWLAPRRLLRLGCLRREAHAAAEPPGPSAGAGRWWLRPVPGVPSGIPWNSQKKLGKLETWWFFS